MLITIFKILQCKCCPEYNTFSTSHKASISFISKGGFIILENILPLFLSSKEIKFQSEFILITSNTKTELCRKGIIHNRKLCICTWMYVHHMSAHAWCTCQSESIVWHEWTTIPALAMLFNKKYFAMNYESKNDFKNVCEFLLLSIWMLQNQDW